MKNRALRAVSFLQHAPGRVLSSLELAKLLPTNHASRAIDEAENLGYEFKRGWIKISSDFYRTYELVENEKLADKKIIQYRFRDNRAIPI